MFGATTGFTLCCRGKTLLEKPAFKQTGCVGASFNFADLFEQCAYQKSEPKTEFHDTISQIRSKEAIHHKPKRNPTKFSLKRRRSKEIRTRSEDEYGIRDPFFWFVILPSGARFFVKRGSDITGFMEFSDEDGAWRFAMEDFVEEENEGRRFWWVFDIFSLRYLSENPWRKIIYKKEIEFEWWERERETLKTEWTKWFFFVKINFWILRKILTVYLTGRFFLERTQN